MKNYTSEVPVERTISRIEQLLAKAGAEDIMKKYRDGELEALAFSLEYPGPPKKKLMIRLPAKVDAVEEILFRTVKRPRPGTESRIREQARRTAWKIQQDWVEVQMTLIELNQVEPLQAFMAFVWMGKETLYEQLRGNDFKMLTGPKPED